MLNEESSGAPGEDIDRTVRVPLEYPIYRDAASDLGVIPIRRKEDSEFPVAPFATLTETLRNHRFVAGLVDSKWNTLTRKYNEGEGKDREGLRGHA